MLDLSNISNATCTLYGFPGMSLAGGGSPVKQIGLAAAKKDHSSPRVLVTLAPGAVANALLRIVQAANFPPSRCDLKDATYLQIYPPKNQTTPVYLKYKAQACAKPVQILTVSVVKAGPGAADRAGARLRPAQPRGDRRAVRAGALRCDRSEPHRITR